MLKLRPLSLAGKRFSRLLSLFTLLLLAAAVAPAQAGYSTDDRVDDWLEELRDSAVDYTVFGTVCEQVARLEYADDFPPSHYDIVVGIQYMRGSRVLGELDVVVFRRKDRQAVLVGEVKCRRSFSAARRKAEEQLNRFAGAIRHPRDLRMRHVGGGRGEVLPTQFQGRMQYVAIAQEGATDNGFDEEIHLTLEEARLLHRRLLNCQDRGECARPRHK